MTLQLEDELLQAIAENHTTAVAALLSAGADPNAGLFRDEPALSIAVRNGSEGILDLLLQRGPICCMKEEHGDAQKHHPSLVLTLKFAVTIITITLATYAVRKLAVSLPLGAVQTLGLYGSHYLWFIFHYSHVSFYSTRSLRRRYSDPWTYVNPLFAMIFPQRILGYLNRHILPAPPLPLPSPTYLHDVAVALPLRFGIDLMVAASCNLLTKVGLIKTGNFPLLPKLGRWRSPAERVLESVLESESVTEIMVLKLLRADTLASQPYDRSEVARKLLGLAVNKCWPELTRFLVGARVPVDQGVSPASNELKWPAPSEVFIYAFPSVSLSSLPVSYFDGQPVLSHMDTFNLESPKQISTFVQLVQSRKFRDLATSQSEDNWLDWADCQRMMNILRDGGADPLLTDHHGHDALSYLVQMSPSTNVLIHMAQLWREARAHSPNTEGYLKTASPALYEAINTTVPNLETLRILLDAGVSPEWENQGRTPLFAAAYMNRTTDAMGLLFEFDANPNNGGEQGYPPILRTLLDTSYEKFVFFLDHEADPNGTKDDGKTILQIVLELEPSLVVLEALLVHCLIERGSLVYDAATQSSPPFLTAARQCNPGGWGEVILDLLLEQIPIDQQQKQLDAALLVACGTIHTVGHAFTSFYLLRKGADPASLRARSDLLFYLISPGRELCDHEYRHDIRTLLKRRILDVNARGEEGQFPLHNALERGSRDLVLLLLEHGADPELLDAKGQTPLQLLCKTEPPKYTISQSNSEVESDIDDPRFRGVRGQAVWGLVSRSRRQDIKCSLEQEEMFQALVDHDADIEVMDVQGRTLLMMACAKGNSTIAANILYRLGKKRFAEAINTADFMGKTAVHLAAANGDVKTLKVLLDPQQILRPEGNPWRKLAVEGEDCQVQKDSESSRSATHKSMAQQVLTFQECIISCPAPFRAHSYHFTEPEEVKLTIGDARRREDTNICFPNVSVSTWTIDKREDSILRPEKLVDLKFRTPLHYAAESGHLEAVKFILRYMGINVDVEDNKAQKAVDLAQENNFYDISSIL
jgi:ankyrin repeat protein